MDDPDTYPLPEAENARIFRESIVPGHLGHAQSQARPTVVFLVAQQGAGKTREAGRIGAQLDRRGGYVEIDSDVYKTYHPAYARLMAEDDQRMAAYTAKDGQRWSHQAQTYAREQRLNVLIQETAQNPPYFAEVAKAYRDAGYHVAIEYLGVPEAMSRQGVLHRYHEQVRDRGHGRLTVPAKRDASYRGIPETADLVERHHLAHEVSVRRRGEAEPRYLNRREPTGPWQGPVGLHAAIEAERTRPWNADETVNFLQVQHRLSSEMPPEFQDELRRIQQLATPMLDRGAADASEAMRLTQQGRPSTPPNTVRPTVTPTARPNHQTPNHQTPDRPQDHSPDR